MVHLLGSRLRAIVFGREKVGYNVAVDGDGRGDRGSGHVTRGGGTT